MLAFAVGPILWLIAVVVVGLVVRELNAVEVALLCTIIAFSVSLVFLGFVRELERKAARRANKS